jgi:glycine/D-amino acid oxidase-like deaminating enzyme
MDEIKNGSTEVVCDVLVIGGGTAGPMAAYKAKRCNPNARVVLLEKANVKRSGAIAMGMDGLNNAVVPGYGIRAPETPRSEPSTAPRRRRTACAIESAWRREEIDSSQWTERADRNLDPAAKWSLLGSPAAEDC